LDVGEPYFAMLKNESVSAKVLGMGEPYKGPFRAVLVATVFQVVEHVSGSVGVQSIRSKSDKTVALLRP
jgi:hypothetical protein